MRKVILFIAMSLDGYIADENGGVAWLDEQNNASEDIDAYSLFIQNVDTVIMGWNTYQQIVTELSPANWPYEQQTTYVITHKRPAPTEKIIFTAQNPGAVINELRTKDGKNIWICGGAQIVQQLVKADLIDEYHISVIPVLLGAGIRLFGTHSTAIKLNLRFSRNYNGIVELIYNRR